MYAMHHNQQLPTSLYSNSTAFITSTSTNDVLSKSTSVKEYPPMYSRPTNDYRTKNAIAQAKHRAKRKAYVEQLESRVNSLQATVSASSTSDVLARIQHLEDENSQLRKETQTLRAQLAFAGYPSSSTRDDHSRTHHPSHPGPEAAYPVSNPGAPPRQHRYYSSGSNPAYNASQERSFLPSSPNLSTPSARRDSSVSGESDGLSGESSDARLQEDSYQQVTPTSAYPPISTSSQGYLYHHEVPSGGPHYKQEYRS